MPDSLKCLAILSQAVGAKTALVQGGGGNVSVKTSDGKTMFIKASGIRLSEVTETTGFAALRMDKMGEVLSDPALAQLEPVEREKRVLAMLLDARETPESPRPSVESSLHTLLGRFVVHTHPTMVTGMVASKSGKEFAEKLSRQLKLEILWIPYTEPGYPLACLVRERIEAYKKTFREMPKAILLANHGLFVSSNDFEEAAGLTEKVLAGIEKLTGPKSVMKAPHAPAESEVAGAVLSLRGALYKVTGSRWIVKADTGELARWLSTSAGEKIVRTAALAPDEIVYCRREPFEVTKKDFTSKEPTRMIAIALEKYIENHKLSPKLAVLANMGIAGIGSAPQAAHAALEMYLSASEAKIFSHRFGGPRPLTRAQADYLETWEVESYRRSLMEGSAAKPLAGRVAFVTGAASGLGKNLAIGLANAGAYVGCADVDMQSLQGTIDEIGAQKAVALRADVTEESSVENAMMKLVTLFGGLDILVNAAGIAPSHPLQDFPAEQWRKTVEINLTGYFLAAREAARVFIRQGMGGNIINLSSKTGLEASVNNTAYNATKAGEIHLARGWALELGKHGIRVNSIAPGNVFRGSKIWNSQYIRECARKKGIKPEDVIPYYIGLSALKKEILPEDIVNAAVFLASDASSNITGQTLVIDGGQVMVR